MEEIKKQIKKAKKILLVTHKKPDGDALGSILAFSLVLKKLKKEVFSLCHDPFPSLFSFLPEKDEIKNELERKDFDLSIFLDCASLSLSGFENIKPDINIDHHPTNSNYGRINLVDTKRAATAEILYHLFLDLNVEIDKDIAFYLLVGIFTDTGSFQNQNTTSSVLNVASHLLNSGARLEKIAKNTYYNKSVSTLKLWGKALSRLWENKKWNLALTIITKEDLKETKTTYEDIEGVTNFLNTIPSVSALLVLSEQDNEIKGSLRTRRDEIDVSKLAKLLGGGGHEKAAGFEVKGRLKYEDGRWKVI